MRDASHTQRDARITETLTFKCLSVHQPAAQLLAVGKLRWHERSWTTGYRGWVVIHASDQFDQRDLDLFAKPRVRIAFRIASRARELPDAPRGCFVGIARLWAAQSVQNAFPQPGEAGAGEGERAITLSPLDSVLNPLDDRNTLLGFRQARLFTGHVYARAKAGLWDLTPEGDPDTHARLARLVEEVLPSTELSAVAPTALSR